MPAYELWLSGCCNKCHPTLSEPFQMSFLPSGSGTAVCLFVLIWCWVQLIGFILGWKIWDSEFPLLLWQIWALSLAVGRTSAQLHQILQSHTFVIVICTMRGLLKCKHCHHCCFGYSSPPSFVSSWIDPVLAIESKLMLTNCWHQCQGQPLHCIALSILLITWLSKLLTSYWQQCHSQHCQHYEHCQHIVIKSAHQLPKSTVVNIVIKKSTVVSIFIKAAHQLLTSMPKSTAVMAAKAHKSARLFPLSCSDLIV